MRKLIVSLCVFSLLLTFSSAVLGNVLFEQRSREDTGSVEESILETEYGRLEFISVKPKNIRLNTGTYNWSEFTVFLGESRQAMLPRRFWRKYKNLNVEVRIDDNNIVQLVRPAPM